MLTPLSGLSPDLALDLDLPPSPHFATQPLCHSATSSPPSRSRLLAFALPLLAAASAHAQPFAFTYSDARFNGNQHLLRVNLASGVTSDIGALNAGHIEALCIAPNGHLYGLQCGHNFVSYLWDLTTPPGTPIGRDTFSGRISEHPGIAIDPATGLIWNAQGHPAHPLLPGGSTPLYRINPANAHVDRAFTAAVAANRFFDSLAINAAGQAFGADFADTRRLYRVNLTNGTHSVVGPLNVTERHRLSDISFDSAGRLWAIAGRGDIYRIDTTTGAATRISTIDRPNQFWTTLAVIPGPACPADFNHDTTVNSQDFFDFLAAFFASDPSSDFNQDGAINSQDFFDYLNAFFAGC